MKNVAISGFGITKFTRDDLPIESLMASAVKSLFVNTPNLVQKDVDAILTATSDSSKYLSSITAELTGITPKISHNVESLCNSGANCAISAFAYIASGLADVALVVGAERFDSPGLILEWDKSRGQFRHPIYWSSIFTKSHMRRYGTTMEDLAIVSAKNHKNALANPYAYFEKEFSINDIMRSKNLTEDIRLLDCSYPCSGSAAILLTSEDVTKRFTDCPIWITGIGQRTVSASFTKNHDFTAIQSTREAANDAYKMSSKESSEIDVAEVHDAFSICEIIEVEDLGFAIKGNGSKYVREMYDTQNRRINPRGGLLGSGHPLGATGIAQIIEIVQQLRGEAKKRQVEGADVGLVQNMSAAATSSTVLIMQS